MTLPGLHDPQVEFLGNVEQKVGEDRTVKVCGLAKILPEFSLPVDSADTYVATEVTTNPQELKPRLLIRVERKSGNAGRVELDPLNGADIESDVIRGAVSIALRQSNLQHGEVSKLDTIIPSETLRRAHFMQDANRPSVFHVQAAA